MILHMENLMDSIMIRFEIPIDAPGIDKLLRTAFKGDAEADLVQQLREDGLLALGVVATDDEGTVVAYAAFSQVKIEKNINDPEWVALAPLAVEENWRGQGCGSALVINALNTLNDFGYAGVVVLGDPAYYNKLGFTSAASYQLWCCWPGSEAAFQVLPLAKDVLSGVSGQVVYSKPFNRL